MPKYDLVVIGAGPAGLSVAKVVAPEAKVLVCEMRASVGDQAIATWIPLNFLPSNLSGATVEETAEVKFKGIRSEVSARLRGAVLDWKRLVRILALEAVRKGAEIWTSAPVRELLVKNERVVGVRLEGGGWKEEVRSEVVVDASGGGGEWSGFFMKFMGKEPKPEEVGFSAEHLMAGVQGERSVEFHFSAYLFPLGSGWIYPFGDGFAAVGVRGVRVHPELSLDEFVSKVPRLGGASPISSTRGRFPVMQLERLCSNGILAVGGAACQISSFSRGNFLHAIKAGELAGKVILEALTDADVSRERLLEYESLWRQEEGRAFEVEKRLFSLVASSWDQRIEELLGKISEKRHLVESFANLLSGVEMEKSSMELLKLLG